MGQRGITLRFLAELFMLSAQLGARTEQLDDAAVFRCFLVGGIAVAEQAERLQRFHRPRGAARGFYMRNPWPRSMQYSSHLFSIVFRAQR